MYVLYHRGIRVALSHFGCPGVKAGKTAMKKQTNIFMYLGVDDRGYLALLYEGMLFPSIYGYHAHH